MKRLIGAELNRWFSRRMFWVVLAASALLSVLVLAAVAYGSSPMTAAEVAAAEQEYADAQREAEQDTADCLRSGGSAEECEPWVPERDEFLREPPEYAGLAGGLTVAGTLIGAYAALLVGASFMGAEFKTGSIGTWLTYVPARVPVLASKAVVALVGAAVLGVVVIGAFQAGAAGIVLLWSGADALHPVPDAWAMAGRGLVLVVVAGLVGFALATLLGSTAGPVGVLLGLMVAQWALGLVSVLLGAPVWLQAALPDPNLQAFLQGSTEIFYTERGANGAMTDRTFELGLAQASAYLFGLLTLVVAAAGWRFTKREIR